MPTTTFEKAREAHAPQNRNVRQDGRKLCRIPKISARFGT